MLEFRQRGEPGASGCHSRFAASDLLADLGRADRQFQRGLTTALVLTALQVRLRWRFLSSPSQSIQVSPPVLLEVARGWNATAAHVMTQRTVPALRHPPPFSTPVS